MTSTKKRTRQIEAAPAATRLADPAVVAPAPRDDAGLAARHERFSAGVRSLRVGGVDLRLERILMILGGVVAPLGLVVVLLGWWGAAHTPYVFEQVPYLISGGLLGVGLVFLGAFCYFAHWLTQLVKEHRAQSTAVIEALQRLHDQVATQAGPPPSAASSATNGTHPEPVALVATERGTMAHRTDCVVVAGKTGLRPVAAGDGLAPCKLCDPY